MEKMFPLDNFSNWKEKDLDKKPELIMLLL